MRLPWRKSPDGPAFDPFAGEIPEYLEPLEPLTPIRWRRVIVFLVVVPVAVILRPMHHLFELFRVLYGAW